MRKTLIKLSLAIAATVVELLMLPHFAHAYADFIWPTQPDGISTYFSSWHPGIDIMAPCGRQVVSSKWGTVTYAGWDNTGYGNMVVVDDSIDWERYGHLSEISVWYGESVSQGQQIGLVGSTGNSTGCHLHFEVGWYGWGGAAVDPLLPLP